MVPIRLLLSFFFLVLASEFCICVIGDEVFYDESNTDRGYSVNFGTIGKAHATSVLDKNSCRDIYENDTTLGKTIAECYLDPLCFKLNAPK
jgi:hypothetical protein